ARRLQPARNLVRRQAAHAEPADVIRPVRLDRADVPEVVLGDLLDRAQGLALLVEARRLAAVERHRGWQVRREVAKVRRTAVGGRKEEQHGPAGRALLEAYDVRGRVVGRAPGLLPAILDQRAQEVLLDVR